MKSYIPDPLRLREFVCSPPPGGERLFCTMIRHGDEALSGHYTLYLEYLGGLVPLLKGKRVSKLRPDFIIFDPKIKSLGKGNCSTLVTCLMFHIGKSVRNKIISGSKAYRKTKEMLTMIR